MIDLIGKEKAHKDEKLMNYIRKNYLKNNYKTKIVFVYGNSEEIHNQLSPSELRNVMFEENDKNTMYFLGSFYFSNDMDEYKKVIEEACEHDIQIFKTDQKIEHISNDEDWINKYCEILYVENI